MPREVWNDDRKDHIARGFISCGEYFVGHVYGNGSKRIYYRNMDVRDLRVIRDWLDGEIATRDKGHRKQLQNL